MASPKFIYLDHNATTPVDPLVLEAMLPHFSEHFGNAASLTHAAGHLAQRAVQEARSRIAALIGADPREIIFTSSATESNNLALLGIVRPFLGRGAAVHVITQATEHPSVLEPCRELERLGAAVTILPVDRTGRISLTDLKAAIRPETVLVSIMAANHELGTQQSFREIGQFCRDAKILFHSDATQAIGKITIDVHADCIDLLSLSGHKFHGPKGAAALYIRAKSPPVQLHPLLFGGQHERGLRPGTLNVPEIVGFGKAAELAMERLAVDPGNLARLRDRLETGLLERIPNITVNGLGPHRLPNVSNITFHGIEGEALINALDDLAVSSGSACSSASRQASPVLLAIGLPESAAFSTLRISLGRSNTDEEVTHAIDRFAAVVRRLLTLNPRLAT